MAQWKRFDKSHYTKSKPEWLQRASSQSMIISLWESISCRQMQSLWLLFWLLSPILQSQAISSTIKELYESYDESYKNDLPFFSQNAYTLRANEALYQLSTSSIHVYGTDGVLFTPWKQSLAALWFHFIRDALINLNLTLIITSELPTQKCGMDQKNKQKH